MVCVSFIQLEVIKIYCFLIKTKNRLGNLFLYKLLKWKGKTSLSFNVVLKVPGLL